jgi:hypothetical protein
MQDLASDLDDIQGPLRLPSMRHVLTPAEAAAQARTARGPLHVVDARGAAPALLACALARDEGPVLYVVANADAALRAAADLAFLGRELAGEAALPAPLILTASEGSPYAESRADRRATMTRTATLFHLAARLP